MRYTNRHNLPEPLYKALTTDNYSLHGASLSATGLIKSPREAQLSKRHDDKVVVDASSLIYRMMGTMGHSVIELGGGGEAGLLEELLFLEVDGIKVKGQPDYLTVKEKTLIDWKFSSAWSYIYGKPEWEQQLNIYRIMAENNLDIEIDKLEVWLIIRDWQRGKAKSDPDYPKIPFARMVQKVWSHKKAWNYIESRVKLHKAAAEIPDDELPECTHRERWATDDTWAVMKNKNKRATRVLNSLESAENVMSFLQKKNPKFKYRIERRKGYWRKCIDGYCVAGPWCNQLQDHLKQERLAGKKV